MGANAGAQGAVVGDPNGNGGNSLKIWGQKYALSVMSACVAETITYPLDLTKTRLQIQGEVASKSAYYSGKKQGMFRIAADIAANEGLFRLWQGLSPSLARHAVYSGVRISLYEKLRSILSGGQHSASNPRHRHSDNLGLPLRILCGLTCGATAQLLASPTDLVKVRMQMEGRRLMVEAAQGGTKAGSSKKPSRMIDIALEVIRRGGVLGLWKGCVPNVQRAALVNMGELTAYDYGKSLLVREAGFDPQSKITHICASMCSSFVAATVGTPADVVKTRVMNQPLGSDGKGLYYKGSVDCLVKAVQEEGLLSLYKGFVPTLMRMAPWSMSFWLSYEQFRIFFGITSW